VGENEDTDADDDCDSGHEENAWKQANVFFWIVC